MHIAQFQAYLEPYKNGPKNIIFYYLNPLFYGWRIQTQRGNNVPKAVWQIRGKDRTVCMTKDSVWYFSLPPTPSLPILANVYTIENIATGGGQWKRYSKVFLVLAICSVEYVKSFNCLS